MILNTFQHVFQHIFAQTIFNKLKVNIPVLQCSTKQQTYFLGAYWKYPVQIYAEKHAEMYSKSFMHI